MKIFVFVLMMCVSALSHADGADATFAGLKWGSTPLVVGNKLKELGFTVPYTKDVTGLPAIRLDNHEAFTAEGGYLNGQKAQVRPLFKENRLLKVVVNLQTEDNDAISTYIEMKRVFLNKHGPADKVFSNFISPYYAGDGYEQQAIKLGKATIAAYWMPYLLLQITDALTVQISYESPEWEAESARRKEKATGVF